ncbi:hypothetical protein GCM10010278_84960 [Streptomyces melanogenes]|nr:hypothetical protein GCM10010278_84960 [Streptomyces melanogenes]
MSGMGAILPHYAGPADCPELRQLRGPEGGACRVSALPADAVPGVRYAALSAGFAC